MIPEHQATDGFMVRLDERIDHPAKLLRTIMWAERYERFCKIHEDVFAGRVSLQDLYAGLETAEEATLFISTQAEVSLAVGAKLYERLQKLMIAGASACDLGCFTGCYLAWLAENHPDCKFVGFDRNPKAVRFADGLHQAENLRFECWDYACDDTPAGTFNVLYSIFGMEFDCELMIELATSLDLGDLRDCDAYRQYHRFTRPYFASWRRAACEGAELLLVARITSFEQFLAVVDAASDAGWSAALDNALVVIAGDEAFPLLAFTNSRAARIDDARLRRWWGDHAERRDVGPVLRGMAAIEEYLAIPARCVIEQQDFGFPDGNTLRVETGFSARGGYLLHRSTCGFTALELSSVERVKAVPLAGLDLGQLPVRLG
jgi:hypothetical protein